MTQHEQLFMIAYIRFMDSHRFKKRRREGELLDESKKLFEDYMKSDFFGMGWVLGSMEAFLRNRLWDDLK